MRAAVLTLLLVAACGATATPAKPAVEVVAVTADGGSGPLCLPVVSGCGCAYACGTSLRRNADGTYEIVHDLLDSATVIAERARWCFDDAGRGTPAFAAEPAGQGCIDVFYDRTSCGGECIPQTAHLRCRAVEGACRSEP